MKIKFKKLHEGARLPEKATEGSAAYDLYVTEDFIVKPGRSVIPLGFAMEMDRATKLWLILGVDSHLRGWKDMPWEH